MSRRTQSKQEFLQQESIVWQAFRPKLENLTSLDEARALASQPPPENSPGRIFYTNLICLLQDFIVPGQSNNEEKRLYLQFIKKLPLETFATNTQQGIERLQQDLERRLASRM